MPIYAYQCQACRHSLDALQKLSDDPLRDCPQCGAPSLRKQLTAPVFRLKGGGWYETDFKTDNRRNLAESGDGAKPDASKPADGAATPAPAAATPAATTTTTTAASPAASPAPAAGT